MRNLPLRFTSEAEAASSVPVYRSRESCQLAPDCSRSARAPRMGRLATFPATELSRSAPRAARSFPPASTTVLIKLDLL